MLSRLIRLGCSLILAAAVAVPAQAVDALEKRILPPADFATVHEVLVESIEAEGLVVAAVIPFNRMLQRTATTLGKSGSPFAEAEIVQFCSSVLAWQMLEEDPAQIAFCPLSLAIYEKVGQPGRAMLVFRVPGPSTAGHRAAARLLYKLADQVGATLKRRSGAAGGR